MAIVERLEANGLTCWVAPRDVVPGMDYREEILRGVDESDAFVLVLSAAANDSDVVAKEVLAAENRRKRVCPLRIEDVKPSAALELHIANTHWIDAFSGPLENHVDQLARSLKPVDADPAKPLPTPPPPKPQGPSKMLIGTGVAGLAVAVVAAVLVFTGAGQSLFVDDGEKSGEQVVVDNYKDRDPVSGGDGAKNPPDNEAGERRNPNEFVKIEPEPDLKPEPGPEPKKQDPEPKPNPAQETKQKVEVVVVVKQDPEPTPKPTVDPVAEARVACLKALTTVSTHSILDLQSVSKPMPLNKLLDHQLEALSRSEAKFVVDECENPDVVKDISPEQRTALAIAQLRDDKAGMAERTLAPAASAGESWANFILGVRQLSRTSQTRDQIYRGEDHLTRASDAGNASAKLALGLLYLSRGDEYGDKVNKGLGLLGQVARQDYGLANFEVGRIYSGLLPKYEDRRDLPLARQKFAAARALGFSLPHNAELVLNTPTRPTRPAPPARQPAPETPVVHVPKPDPVQSTGTRVSGRMRVPNTHAAAIYEEPRKQSKKIARLAPGTVVSVRERYRGGLWYRVDLGSGATGYAFKTGLESIPGERVAVADPSVFVPSGSSDQAAAYGAVDSNKLRPLIPSGDSTAPKNGKLLVVEGAVRNPGSHAIKSVTTVKKALQIAGGLAPNADAGSIQLIRGRDNKRLKALPSTIVRPGDKLIVQSK